MMAQLLCCGSLSWPRATMFLQHCLEGSLEKQECPEEKHKERCHESSGKYLARESVLDHILMKGLLITMQFYWNNPEGSKRLLNLLGKGIIRHKCLDSTCLRVDSPCLNVFKSK